MKEFPSQHVCFTFLPECKKNQFTLSYWTDRTTRSLPAQNDRKKNAKAFNFYFLPLKRVGKPLECEKEGTGAMGPQWEQWDEFIPWSLWVRNNRNKNRLEFRNNNPLEVRNNNPLEFHKVK